MSTREPTPPDRLAPDLGNEDPAVVTARLEATPAARVSARELVEWLGDPHEPLRELARRRLRERQDLDALRLALRWLDEPRVPHAAQAAYALMERAPVEDVVLAARVLEEAPRPGAVAWATRVAARRAHPALLARSRVLARHLEPSIRRAALAGLASDPDSREVLLAALADPEEAVRAEVLTAWERRPPARIAAEAFARALVAFAPHARSTRERRAVATAAALLNDESLLELASRDEDASVRAVALTARARNGTLRAEERAHAEGHEDPWLRLAVLDLSTARRACVEDPDPSVRRAALDLWVAWNRQPSDDDAPEPRDVALACAQSPDPWVRARACDLLDPTRAPEELHALLRLSHDTSPMARAAAASVLESCDGLDARLDTVDAPDLQPAVWTWRLRHANATALQRLSAALDSAATSDELTAHLEALTLVFPDDALADAPSVARHRPTPAPKRPRTPAMPRPRPEAHASWRPLGTTGLRVSPLVLSGANLTTPEPFFEARDAGVNAFFWEPRYTALTRFLRAQRDRRDELVVVAGTYHAGEAALRRDVESALRRLRTTCLDVFLLFWVRSPERLSDGDFAALERLRAEGKVRAFGFSTHLRDLAREALHRAPWPVVMTRHSAAHPGAEAALLPEAQARGTGVLTFSTTCYGRLLRPTPEVAPDAVLPSAVDCYRYSLSQPGVSASLTAPRSWSELRHNLDVLARPRMEPDALPAMRAHGERVRARERELDARVRRAPGGPREALLALLEEGEGV
ncbi:aldo/keto reductase [Corallococcus sp. M34]|uniref:aldo/keto reductase n=1 Tax=Citreicoccus inhibens TaxID=2849499 RepID=UPI001C24DDE9|nr:aldo/keto reductase [Citreicoccus inhibens]MBU8898759.1 aldo/keto reductase [Citreicoccus inhibens]